MMLPEAVENGRGKERYTLYSQHDYDSLRLGGTSTQ